MKYNKLILIATMLLVACGSSQKKDEAEELFSAMFPDMPINVGIKFWEPTEKFYNGKSVDLDLENNSNYTIKYARPDDIYALFFDGNSWVRLPNYDVYLPPYDILFPKGPDYPGVTVVSFTPQFSGMPLTSVDVRVVVIATIYENGESTNKKTGAYIDVKLNP